MGYTHKIFQWLPDLELPPPQLTRLRVPATPLVLGKLPRRPASRVAPAARRWSRCCGRPPGSRLGEIHRETYDSMVDKYYNYMCICSYI